MCETRKSDEEEHKERKTELRPPQKLGTTARSRPHAAQDNLQVALTALRLFPALDGTCPAKPITSGGAVSLHRGACSANGDA